MVNPKGLPKLAAAVPILVTVAVCGLLVEPTTTLPKSSEDGERVKMMLPVPPPVPLTGSFCGLPGALSLMKTAPDRVPPEVGGVKVTFIVQKPPGCKVPSQFTPPARNGWRRHRFVMSAIHLGGGLRTLGWVPLFRGRGGVRGSWFPGGVAPGYVISALSGRIGAQRGQKRAGWPCRHQGLKPDSLRPIGGTA